MKMLRVVRGSHQEGVECHVSCCSSCAAVPRLRRRCSNNFFQPSHKVCCFGIVPHPIPQSDEQAIGLLKGMTEKPALAARRTEPPSATATSASSMSKELKSAPWWWIPNAPP